ncbi:MAG: hypothetical protein AAFY46_00950, partial [Planctomycetota bacterium]
ERKYGKKSWGASTKAGAGAAAGKLVSTLLKAGVAAVMVIVLSVAAFWPNGGEPASLELSPSGMLDIEAEPSTDLAPSTQDRDVTTDDRPPAGDDQPEPDPDS